MTPYAKVENGKVVAVMKSYPEGYASKLLEWGWRACPNETMPGCAYDEEEYVFGPSVIGTPSHFDVILDTGSSDLWPLSEESMPHYAKVKDGIVIAVIQDCPAGSESQLLEMGWHASPRLTKPGWTYKEEEASFYPPPKETALPRRLIVRPYEDEMIQTGISAIDVIVIVERHSLAELGPDMDVAFPYPDN